MRQSLEIRTATDTLDLERTLTSSVTEWRI